MIRLLLALFLALGLGAFGAHALRAQTGYVLIRLGDWSVETSLAGLLLAALFLAIAGWLLLRLIAGGLQLPETLRGSLIRRRHARAWARFEEGSNQLLRGEYKAAERTLVRSARDLPAGHLAYLGAARAAQAQAQTKAQAHEAAESAAAARREHYLQTVIEQHAADAALAELVRAELALARDDAAAARDAAIRACQHAPCAARATELRAQALCRLKDWDGLHALLSDKTTATRLDPAHWPASLDDCWVSSLEARLTQAAASVQIEQINRIHAQAPERIRQHPRIRLAYARALSAQTSAEAAAAYLVSALEQSWDSALVDCYGRLSLSDPLAQLAQTERWLATHGERFELLLAAGRCCLRNRLWGKARGYLQAAQRAHPGAEVALELAQLCEQTGQTGEALQHYRSGLEQVVRASG